MNGKYYKPSDKFSVVGLLLMILCTTLAGMAISFVYLKVNSVCPVVYLCVLMAVLFGAAMGGVAYFFIKKFKLRSPKMVIVSLCVALLFTTYFKWALYDHFDRQDQYDYVADWVQDGLDELSDSLAAFGVNLDLDKPITKGSAIPFRSQRHLTMLWQTLPRHTAPKQQVRVCRRYYSARKLWTL